jgi:uncharacterized SAM-binding protein YcdF (DUF218 family)
MASEAHSAEVAGHRTGRRRGLRALAIALLFAVFCAALWIGRAPALRGASDLWVASDELAPADAVAVLGGGIDTRPFTAAEYYRKGLVTKVLVADVLPRKSAQIGVVQTHAAVNRRILMRLQVPEQAIELFGNNVSNTYEEAKALREWALRNGATRVLVPTEELAVRRTRWIMQRVFAGTGIDVRVPGLDDPEFERTAWWRSEKSVVAFQNEVVKYLYYRAKY